MAPKRLQVMATHTFASTDAQQAYLFQCGDNGLFAVSLDASGENLPRGACAEGWRLKVAFLLGVREPVPASISPEPILRGVRAVGYYVWREGMPHGTSQ
jgi:hypothetical protein